MDHRFVKEQKGLKESKRALRKQANSKKPKERSSKPMGIMRNGKQARMGRRNPNEGIK